MHRKLMYYELIEKKNNWKWIHMVTYVDYVVILISEQFPAVIELMQHLWAMCWTGPVITDTKLSKIELVLFIIDRMLP